MNPDAVGELAQNLVLMIGLILFVLVTPGS